MLRLLFRLCYAIRNVHTSISRFLKGLSGCYCYCCCYFCCCLCYHIYIFSVCVYVCMAFFLYSTTSIAFTPCSVSLFFRHMILKWLQWCMYEWFVVSEHSKEAMARAFHRMYECMFLFCPVELLIRYGMVFLCVYLIMCVCVIGFVFWLFDKRVYIYFSLIRSHSQFFTNPIPLLQKQKCIVNSRLNASTEKCILHRYITQTHTQTGNEKRKEWEKEGQSKRARVHNFIDCHSQIFMINRRPFGGNL